MTEFILKYWLEIFFASIVSLMTVAIKRLGAKAKEQDLVKDGVVAMLHDRLFQIGELYINQRKYITLDELNNVEYLYNSYKGLGGNGTGTAIWEKLQTLPSRPQSDKGE